MALKVVVLRVTLLLLVAVVARVDARLDFSPILSSMSMVLETDNFVLDAVEDCCDTCYCTKSIPPQCRCTDIKPYCYPSCKGCICTRSIPPQCRCTDITNFCYKPCTSEGGHETN